MSFIKKHWPIILVALIVGIFSIMPLVFSLQRMGDSFQGIWPQFNSDANFYLSRSHEVLDGHPEMNHQYFAEHKDATYPQAIGGEQFLAFLAQSLNISIPTASALLTFIMPAIMAALFYALLMMLYQNRASAFILSLAMFTVISGGMIKPIHPMLSFPLLLVFLISWLYLVLKKNHKTASIILCGTTLGLLFLTYFFHWSFLLVVLGIYSLILLITKDYKALKHHIIFLGVAAIVAIPFFIRLISGVDTPLYQDMALRMGVYATHWPETFPRLAVAVFWLAAFIAITRHYKLNRSKYSYIIFTLLIANIIYPNHQVISGVTIENANHWSFMPIFIYAISAHYLINTIIDHTRAKRILIDKGIIGIIVIMLIVPAWRLQTFNFPSYKLNLAHVALEESQQHYAEALDWINNNTEVDSVVFSHAQFMEIVPIYTHANVYYTQNAPYLIGSDNEVVERTILSHFFDIDSFRNTNFGMNEVGRILWTQPAMIERNIHWMHNKLNIAYEQKYSLKKELAMVQSIYESLQSEGWNLGLLQRYKLDYIVWDKALHTEWSLDIYPELEKLYSKGDIIIYGFKE